VSGLRLHHVALQVTDLDVARAFYVDVLGLVVVREQAHSVWVDAGGVIVMLERCTGPVINDDWPSDRPGPFVVAFSVRPDERAGWLERLAAANVAVDHASGFTIYFRDPFGARLALSHYPEA
jgi:catechol 2,3-dioxygenase-like lactoylglutathione lyase family enzyme